MSETWPGLSGTGFPDVIDPYQIYVDINEQNYTQIEEIQTDITNHDFAGAKAILEANPTLSNCIVTAATLQRFEDQIIAIQKTWKSSIINQIANIVTYKETYSPTTSYKLFDIISYSNKAYMCTSDDSITDILPTNQDYWIPIVLQGISGGTMAFYTTWSSSQEYKVQDLVPYGSSLYVCITQNTNQIPPDSPDYWHVALVSGKQTIWSENQPENQVTGDEWKQTNSNDSSYITHLRQDSGYITKYPTSNADFIQDTNNAGVTHNYICTTTGINHNLTISTVAANGRFKADADFNSGDTFSINGATVEARIQNGDLPVTGFFKSGYWCSFTYDSSTSKITFVSGGGSSTIPNYAGQLIVHVTTSDSGSLGSTEVRVRNEQLGSNYTQSLNALGDTTFSLIDNHTYYVVLLNYPSSYYGAAATVTITGGETQTLNLELSTTPDIIGWKMRQDTGVIEYTDQAISFQPAVMGTTFDYGSFTDSWLVKNIKPCLLKNGVVQYYLNPNDYTKKVDDTASDITTGTDGNVMIEFPLIYYKFYEETDINNVIWTGCKFSQTPQDDTWCANAFLNINGIIQSTMYMAAYDGYVNNNVLYSLSGKTPSNNITIGNFRIYATANGSGYQQQEWSKRVFLQSLFIMLFKSTDSQTALGKGVTGASVAISSGSMNDKGLFWGDQTGINGVKFCGIENFWGNISKFCDGLILSSYVYKYKIYGLYNDTASGYLTGNTAPNTGHYIKVMYSNNGEGLVPKTNDTVSSYYYDYFYLSSGTNICYTGGYWGNGARAGVFYLYLNSTASYAYTDIDASLSFTPV